MSQSHSRFALPLVIALCVIACALVLEITLEDDALADPPDASIIDFMGNDDLSIMKFVEGDFIKQGIPQETPFEACLTNPSTGNTIALVPGEFSLGGPQYVYIGEFDSGDDPTDDATTFYGFDGITAINIDDVLELLSQDMFLVPPLARVDILSTFPLADDAFGSAFITKLPQGNYKVVELDHPTAASYSVLYLSDNEPSDGSIELDGSWGKSVDVFNSFNAENESGEDPDPGSDRGPEEEEEELDPKFPPPPPTTSEPMPPPKAPPSPPAIKSKSAPPKQTARAMPRTGDFMNLGFWGLLTALATVAAVPVLTSLKDKEGDSDE